MIHKAKYHERKSNLYERPTFRTRNVEEKDMLREVEHFQNQFIVQKQNIDAFLHDINADEHKLVEFAKDHPVALNHVHFEDHTKTRDNMEGFARTYNEIKQEFRKFLVKWK